MTTKTKHVSVIGAGITGCTISRLLAEKGFDVVLFEQDEAIGGACRDTLEGIKYTQLHGSHIFHTNDERVWSFTSRFTDWTPYQHRVIALIDGNLVPIPFNLNSLAFLDSPSRSAIISELHNIEYGKELTLNDMLTSGSSILQDFGKYIKQKVFEGYSTKQWGKMPEDSTLNRVKAFRNSKDDRYFLDKYQGIPSCGFSTMLRKMTLHENIQVHFNTTLTLDELKQMGNVVYTGAIDTLFNYRFGQLPYRTCMFKYSIHSGLVMQDNAVINYPNDYKFTRAHDFSYYMPGVVSHIVYEYPEEFKVDDDINIRYYPIESDENKALYMKYRKYAFETLPNTVFAGRLGTYRYLNMDKAIMQAFELSRLF